MATTLFRGSYPRCTSETAVELQESNELLGVWWKIHILALGTGVCNLHIQVKTGALTGFCLREPLVLMHRDYEPSVTWDILKVKCLGGSHLTFYLLKELVIFEDWAELCQWCHRVLPSMITSRLCKYDLWTGNNYKSHTDLFWKPMTKPIVYTLVLFYPLLRKTKVCDKNAALWAHSLP